MSNIWIFDVQSMIYSRAKAMILSKLKKKYSDLTITDNDEEASDAKFPTVYIHFLQPFERGQDLEGQEINAISLTAEVQVTTTKAQGMTVAREVSAVVMDVFKEMRFTATMPNFENDGTGTKRMIARYSRTVGSADII